jgi:hypothetical protein
VLCDKRLPSSFAVLEVRPLGFYSRLLGQSS